MFHKKVSPIYLVLISVCSMLGCMTYGSKVVPITLEATSADNRAARAFLVPIEQWKEISEVQDALQPFRPRDPETFQRVLEPYRVKSGRTPVSTMARPYQTIFVVESEGKYQWDQIKPEHNAHFKISLE